MITDEELMQLPDDPELAFVEFEKVIRARLNEHENDASRDQYDADPYRLDYMNRVSAAAKVFDIDTLKDWEVPNVHGKIYDSYKQFSADVDHFTTQIRLHQIGQQKRNSVGLDPNSKTKIRHFVDQIKTIIDVAELSDDKRDSLYKKLNAFANEVDKNRTDIGAISATYLAVCDMIGQGFKKLEPARKWLDSAGAVMGRAKAIEEESTPLLPARTEPRKLAPPRPPEAKSSNGPSWDDEIPF